MTARAVSGYFITFEGGEGAGKSTQVRHLAEALRQGRHDVLLTREPGGSEAAERMRAILLDPALALDAMTQLMLFSAARRDHWIKTIAPALARGAIVICDRFYDSTFAYQGAAGGVCESEMRKLTRFALGDAAPDLTIILDIEPSKGLARAAARRGLAVSDSFERQSIDFHTKIREALLQIATREPKRCLVFNADLPEAELSVAIAAVARQRVPAARAS
jgi:dTMP kinase